MVLLGPNNTILVLSKFFGGAPLPEPHNHLEASLPIASIINQYDV